MGYIAEPRGIDFVIQSPPLTDHERKELSEFIKKRKFENETEILPKRKSNTKQKARR